MTVVVVMYKDPKFEMDFSDELFEAWAELERQPDEREEVGEGEEEKPPDPWTLPISSNARKVLIVIGWYAPLTARGLNTALIKKWGRERGWAIIQELESRKLVRVLEDEKGRSIWNVSRLGVEELGKDYSPRRGQTK